MSWLRARWIAWRNARLSDPRFQRFAADFPLTRAIAHDRTDRLFDIVAGFVYAQVLDACVRLDVFAKLRPGPLDVEALAVAVDLPVDSARRLLNAAAALDLVEKLGDRFALGAQGAALLGNPGLADMIRHHAALYADMQDPVALLQRGRGAQVSGYWPYATSVAPVRESEVSAYSALMASTQPSVAADVLGAYPMRRHKVLMDVGGGAGVFLGAVAERWPHLQLRLFDLPAVVAQARLAMTVASDAMSFISGDFLADSLPEGADLITLVRILHDHDDAGVARLLASAHGALPSGGRLLVAEPMSGEGRSERVGAAYFGMYLLAMGRGRARSPRELGEMARKAGFARSRMLRVRTPRLLRVMVCDA
jgi:demethylspheroidene O-methyltransferase